MSSEQKSANQDPAAEQDGQAAAAGEAAAEQVDTGEAPGGAGDEVAKALAQAEEFRDQYLRSVAELDNVRKRSARELERAHKYGVERMAGELLAVVDSLEMGLEAAGDNADAMVEGVRATLKLLISTLEKFGITPVDPLGEPFNPEWHEAMATQPSADAEPDSVLLVVQKGYRIHDRALRPARVIVARAAE